VPEGWVRDVPGCPGGTLPRLVPGLRPRPADRCSAHMNGPMGIGTMVEHQLTAGSTLILYTDGLD
jgi:hypothetical protein